MNTRSTILSAAVFSMSQALFCANAELQIGTDLNSAQSSDPLIAALFSGNRGTNGGGDQSQQFGDTLEGSPDDDVLIGGLGIDVLFGAEGNDILLGGTEDFNPFNRDRAFGEAGNDVFIWAPGDGNDFFDGGEGEDVLIVSLVGESRNADGETAGAPFFTVSPPGRPGSGDFDGIFLDPDSGMPVVDFLNSPGFCEVLGTEGNGLSALGLDHLTRFILRGPANAFDQALAADPNVDPDTLDTGLRIAVHLSNTEYVVCTSRDGNEIEVFDLRTSPVVKTTVDVLPEPAYSLLRP